MDTSDELDDQTELAKPGAPQNDAVVVWSLGDDLDDEVTEVVSRAEAVGDDLDDEVTEVVSRAEAVGDDLDDEVTAVMDRTSRGETDPLPPMPAPSQPVRRTRPADVRTPAAHVGSLRDRLPETRTPWEPPSRPRSPEFQARAAAKQRSLVPLVAGALVAALVLFAAVWWLVPQDTEVLPSLVDTGEVEVDDAN